MWKRHLLHTLAALGCLIVLVFIVGFSLDTFGEPSEIIYKSLAGAGSVLGLVVLIELFRTVAALINGEKLIPKVKLSRSDMIARLREIARDDQLLESERRVARERLDKLESHSV